MRKLLLLGALLMTVVGCGSELDVVDTDDSIDEQALRAADIMVVEHEEDISLGDNNLAGAPLPEGCYHSYLGDAYNGYVCFGSANCDAACTKKCEAGFSGSLRCPAGNVKLANLPSGL